MKRQIRRGVFETNSSSQHSLCIMKKDEHYTPDEVAKDFYLWDDKETGEKIANGIFGITIWSLVEVHLEH